MELQNVTDDADATSSTASPRTRAFLTEAVHQPLAASATIPHRAAGLDGPSRRARAKLLAKSKAVDTDTADSSDQDATAEDPARGSLATQRHGVHFSSPLRSAAVDSSSASPKRSNVRRPTILTADFPGFDEVSFTFRTIDMIPLDLTAVQAIVETVIMKDPTLANDRALSRFAQSKEFSLMTTGVFWFFAMQLKRTALSESFKERVLRGENPVELEELITGAARQSEEVKNVAFHVAAVAYGSTFGKMLVRQGHNVESALSLRDTLFSRLPMLVAKTVFYVLTLVFSSKADHKMFTAPLREELLTTMTEWISGVKPQNATLAASSHWPHYARRKEAVISSTFDPHALVRCLDERASIAVHQYRSMLESATESGLRRSDDLSSASHLNLRRARRSSLSSLKGRDNASLSGPSGTFTERTGGSSKLNHTDTSGTGEEHHVGRSIVPTLQNKCSWYEQGRLRGSLPVERTTQPSTPRQELVSLNVNSPLMVYYFSAKGISTHTDAPRTSQPMRWSTLEPLDRQGIRFRFESHAKAVEKKAIAFCHENRRVLEASVEAERRAIVTAQRAARYAAGKAALAVLHVRAMHSLTYPPTLALYESLRSSLQHAIAKISRRGRLLVSEVIAQAESVMGRVADHLIDIPHPGRMELQRLSIALFRAARRIGHRHTLTAAEEKRRRATREQLEHHPLGPEGARLLQELLDRGIQGVTPGDEEVAYLLHESAKKLTIEDESHLTEQHPSDDDYGDDDNLMISLGSELDSYKPNDNDTPLRHQPTESRPATASLKLTLAQKIPDITQKRVVDDSAKLIALPRNMPLPKPPSLTARGGQMKRPSVVLVPDSPAAATDAARCEFAVPDPIIQQPYYTPRCSRSSPPLATAEAAAPPLVQAVSPKFRISVTNCRSMRPPCDEEDPESRVLPVQLPSPRGATLQHQQDSSSSRLDIQECASSQMDASFEHKRPDTTPHHQRMTASRRIATSGVCPVQLPIERQVSMATIATVAAGTRPAASPRSQSHRALLAALRDAPHVV